MAGITVLAQTAEVALTAATAKTVLQIVAPTNQRLKVTRWGVYFDGTSTSAEPAQVELMVQTTAGTMSSLTLLKVKPRGSSETIQSTAQHTATSEPTASDIQDVAEVHPQGGYEVIYPIGQEREVAGGGRLGIKITAPANVNVRAKIEYEE